MKTKKRKIDPEQPFVGTYRLGLTNIDLYGQTRSYGGDFYCCPDATSLPRMKISFRYQHWWEVMNVLLHESFEYLTAQRGVRFQSDTGHLGASDSYRFFMDHNDFTNVCDDQAYFLAKCIPDVMHAWQKYRPKRD